jgi:thiamine-monophosphate kinase
MAAEPALAEVSLSLTGEELVTDIEDFYYGMTTLAAQHGVTISGGDITATLLDRMIAVTLFGQTVDHQTLTRSAAKPGDLIVVTGLLGASAAGLALLELPETDPRRQTATAPLLIESHLRPVPRVEAGRMAAQHSVTAGMDLSDGLLGDLPKILRASDVDGILEPDRVPIPAAVRALFPAEAEQFALRGGEDYELLLTMSPEVLANLQRDGAEDGITFTTVGTIIPRSGDETRLWFRDARGDLVPATAGAFDHFGSH